MRTLLVAPPLRSGSVDIEGDEAHHGRTVLRLVVGDAVRLSDGAGRWAEAVVVAVERHRLRIQVAPPTEAPADANELLTIAVAPPKGDRWTDLVRGLTELGVGAIEPLECERGERMPQSFDRAARIAAEALKQCRRGRLPRLGPVTSISSLVRSGAELTVLDRTGRAAAPGRPRPLTLVIGPEGGLAPAELASLHGVGASLVRLATPVLRIETAALAATAVWSAAWLEIVP